MPDSVLCPGDSEIKKYILIVVKLPFSWIKHTINEHIQIMSVVIGTLNRSIKQDKKIESNPREHGGESEYLE